MPEAQPVQGFIAPNRYQLSGEGISVIYCPGCGPVTPAGVGSLSYHDFQMAKQFRGDEISVTEVPDLGTIVSVILQPDLDFGSTTFSLLLPSVDVPDTLGACEMINTEGITTIHRFSKLFRQGQHDLYTITPLSGTACNDIIPL